MPKTNEHISLIDMAQGVREGRLRAVDMVNDALAKIERFNDQVNAFVYVGADSALEQAAQIDQQVADGIDPGPLAGVPFEIKDLRETVKGMPCT